MKTPLRVLIVEDEGLLAMELEATLEDAGHIVVGWAISSTEAMKLVDNNDIDLAMVDVHLDDGPCGVDVARYIGDRTSALVIFTTANPKRLPDDMVGALGVMSKPYSGAGLAAALEYIETFLSNPAEPITAPWSIVLSPKYQEKA